MSRLIIDVSGEQHRKIKTLAALQGKTIKSYVLDKIFPDDDVAGEAWEELSEHLMPRIQDAENNPPAKKTFEQLTEEIIQRRKPQ
ncbi:antitoxin [Reichenbachiella sp. MALMAid0571]|uniref:antitoxin n=1 Tax=Reichenbachiella sp. MALMAid0571 TaxID=3143939 RepID=UPI0032E03642